MYLLSHLPNRSSCKSKLLLSIYELDADAYLAPCQTTKMERFTEIVSGF